MAGFELETCVVRCTACDASLGGVTAPETCQPEVWRFGEPLGPLARAIGGAPAADVRDLPASLRLRLAARRPMFWGAIAWIVLTGLLLWVAFR